jgi:hypothetical protein
MKMVCSLLVFCIAVASAQTGQPDSTGRTATRAMCDAAAPKLQDAGTNKFVLMLTLDETGQIKAFKTEFPKVFDSRK